jgi:hypothetical protein
MRLKLERGDSHALVAGAGHLLETNGSDSYPTRTIRLFDSKYVGIFNTYGSHLPAVSSNRPCSLPVLRVTASSKIQAVPICSPLEASGGGAAFATIDRSWTDAGQIGHSQGLSPLWAGSGVSCCFQLPLTWALD